MDGDPGSIRGSLIEKLSQKASLSQKVFDNTFSVFGRLKEVLHEMSSEIDDALEEEGKDEVKIEYRDRGKFEAQLQIAEDILIFSMHSNVFEFNREHIIWQNSYVRDNRDNSYCGIINIYNFLSDSFKYNRSADEGYLIGRIFVNREMQYFVEGKRQISMKHNNFGTQRIDRDGWNECHVIARGHTLIHLVNGHVMSVVVDDDPQERTSEGLIGMQVHVGPPMKIEFRNIRLKTDRKEVSGR